MGMGNKQASGYVGDFSAWSFSAFSRQEPQPQWNLTDLVAVQPMLSQPTPQILYMDFVCAKRPYSELAGELAKARQKQEPPASDIVLPGEEI